MIEIELKARLPDTRAAEANVASWAKFVKEFDKLDSYFITRDYDPHKGSGFRLRIRSEGGRHSVSFKTKTIISGVEANAEREFEIGDPEAFASIVEKLGAVPDMRKRKIGRAYECGGLTIEFCAVEGLGDYLEIEYLGEGEELASLSPAEFESARERLLSVLERAGVDRSLIEPRSWAELLKKPL